MAPLVIGPPNMNALELVLTAAGIVAFAFGLWLQPAIALVVGGLLLWNSAQVSARNRMDGPR